MQNTLFLQSEIKDPYVFYSKMRKENPVFYDRPNNIWAVYTYLECEQILQASEAYIPVLSSRINQNPELNKVVKHLARLNNGISHSETREAALQLLSLYNHSLFDINALFQVLISEPRFPATIDWGDDISKQLPAMTLLIGFGIPKQTALSILPDIENLVKLMLPIDSEKEISKVLKSVKSVYQVFVQFVFGQLHQIQKSDIHFANFIGILIQSYDGSRGLLSNTLLRYVFHAQNRPNQKEDFYLFVKESLRMDSTIQNTRRVLVQDLWVRNHRIRKGEQILLVLASANRDSCKFSLAEEFKVDRSEKTLSFGSGIHKCIAENFSIQLTAETLQFLENKYSKLEISERRIEYEARINVRLPKKITLRIS